MSKECARVTRNLYWSEAHEARLTPAIVSAGLLRQAHTILRTLLASKEAAQGVRFAKSAEPLDWHCLPYVRIARKPSLRT